MGIEFMFDDFGIDTIYDEEILPLNYRMISCPTACKSEAGRIDIRFQIHCLTEIFESQSEKLFPSIKQTPQYAPQYLQFHRKDLNRGFANRHDPT